MINIHLVLEYISVSWTVGQDGLSGALRPTRRYENHQTIHEEGLVVFLSPSTWIWLEIFGNNHKVSANFVERGQNTQESILFPSQPMDTKGTLGSSGNEEEWWRYWSRASGEGNYVQELSPNHSRREFLLLNRHQESAGPWWQPLCTSKSPEGFFPTLRLWGPFPEVISSGRGWGLVTSLWPPPTPRQCQCSGVGRPHSPLQSDGEGEAQSRDVAYHYWWVSQGVGPSQAPGAGRSPVPIFIF